MFVKLSNRLQYVRRRVHSRLLRHLGGFRSFGAASFDPDVRVDNPEGITVENGVLVLRGGWLYCVYEPGSARKPDLTLGAGAYVGCYSHITCANKVRLGPGCLLANYVYISDSLHRYEDLDRKPADQGLVVGEVEIGKNVWIGEHACIFGSVKIGDHCVIGANAVVSNREIPDHCVVVGVPARIVKRYDPSARQWRKTNPTGAFSAPPQEQE